MKTKNTFWDELREMVCDTCLARFALYLQQVELSKQPDARLSILEKKVAEIQIKGENWKASQTN